MGAATEKAILATLISIDNRLERRPTAMPAEKLASVELKQFDGPNSVEMFELQKDTLAELRAIRELLESAAAAEPSEPSEGSEPAGAPENPDPEGPDSEEPDTPQG